MRHCPFCLKNLPIKAFGVCRARQDGLNRYCKNCNRTRMNERRARLKKQWIGKGNHLSPRGPKPQATQMMLLDNVLAVIAAGARTQKEIKKKAQLNYDQVSDALAVLMLDQKKVTSRVIGDQREYFLKLEAA